jgi:SPP1 gp7 family putative phage head morphogenesis protein
MAESLNTRLHDAFTRRQLRVARVEIGLRREVWRQLALIETELLAVLKVADPFEQRLLRRRQRLIAALLAEEYTPLVTARYARIDEEMQAALLMLAMDEIGATRRIINAVTEEEEMEETPSEAEVQTRLSTTLIPTATRPTDLSATGSTWWERQRDGLLQLLEDQLMVAAALDETLTQATARLRGTSEQGFQDGVMARARSDAARLAQTQVTSAVTQARELLGMANAGVQFVLIHSSIIDSSTSYICLGRHGLMYTLGHEPISHSIPYLGGTPYHPNCRSTIIIGLRQGGALTQETLTTWLRRQGAAFQDELLGPTRARMLREGTLSTPRQLLDSVSGRPLTLEELRA